MDTLIFNKIRRIQAEKDEAKRAELMAQSNEELGQHFARNQHDLEELAFDLFNQAFKDTQPGNLAAVLFEVKTVGLAEIDYIEEDLRGLRVYRQGKGGQIVSDVIRYERDQMPREELVGALDMHQDDITNDFWGMLGKLTTQINKKLADAPTDIMLELVKEAVDQGAGTYAEIPAATINSAGVDPVLEAVIEKSEGRVRIVGTEIAVRRFSRVGVDWGDNIKQGIFETGVVGAYKGAPIVMLNNWENFDGDKVLDNDELLLVGSRAGRVTYYGSTPKVQQLSFPSFMRRWETARDAGFSVYGAEKGRVGRIVLT